VNEKSEPPSNLQAVVDANGIAHVPELEVPLSSYMSKQAKAKFIEEVRKPPFAGTEHKEVKEVRKIVDDYYRPLVQRSRSVYPVDVREQRFSGVPANVITPQGGVPQRNRNRVLINLHGGGFVVGAGLGGLAESIPLAGLAKTKVISVDYREGPENKFPAASEDVALVYRELLKEYKSPNIGIYGCSAGGVLSAMAVAWFQKEGLPKPGAVGIFGAGAFASFYGPPTVAGTWGGDSRYTAPPLLGQKPLPVDPNQAPPLSGYETVYLSTANLSDPLVSPALSPATLAKFPPTLLITGTRSFDMSAAVQTQRALTNAGVDADLHVWDGMGHCFFFDVTLPESQEAFAVMAKFFDSRLGR